MADALEGLFDKPAAAFENALTSLAKKTASSSFQKFKRFLSTASEPFFRKDMGERYLSGDALFGGAAIWAVATILALWQPQLRSPIPFLCRSFMWFKLARLLHFCLYGPLTFAVGGLLVFFHMKFGLQSKALMEQYREAGTPYHSQSRGVPRWEGKEVFVGLAIGAVLLAFDLPAGILFVISCAMSSKLASEQQAAIQARYLDALDQRVEQEYLEDAILGKCPTEITQLHQPLPADMNAEMRNNIAAAAVGKPVKIVAKAPRAKTSTPAPNPSPVPPQ